MLRVLAMSRMYLLVVYFAVREEGIQNASGNMF